MKKTDRFIMHRKWVDYANTLQDKSKLAFYDAVVGFGLDGICPERLEKEALLYFDTEVKPKIEEELLEMEQKEQMEEEV